MSATATGSVLRDYLESLEDDALSVAEGPVEAAAGTAAASRVLADNNEELPIATPALNDDTSVRGMRSGYEHASRRSILPVEQASYHKLLVSCQERLAKDVGLELQHQTNQERVRALLCASCFCAAMLPVFTSLVRIPFLAVSVIVTILILQHHILRFCLSTCGPNMGKARRQTLEFVEASSQLLRVARRVLYQIKCAELRSRGYSLSGRLPPIGRIEQSTAFNQGTGAGQPRVRTCEPLRRGLQEGLHTLEEVIMHSHAALTIMIGGVRNEGSADTAPATDDYASLSIWNLQELLRETRQSVQTLIRCASEVAEPPSPLCFDNWVQVFSPKDVSRLRSSTAALENSLCGASSMQATAQAEKKMGTHSPRLRREVVTSAFLLQQLQHSHRESAADLLVLQQRLQELSVSNDSALAVDEAEVSRWNDVERSYEAVLHRWKRSQAQAKNLWRQLNLSLKQTSKLYRRPWTPGISAGAEASAVDESADVSNMPEAAATDSSKNEKASQSTVRSGDTSQDEPADAISIYEVVAEPGTLRRRRKLQRENQDSVQAPSRPSDLAELHSVLRCRKQPPVLIRRPDRSGWDKGVAEEDRVGRSGDVHSGALEEAATRNLEGVDGREARTSVGVTRPGASLLAQLTAVANQRAEAEEVFQ